MRNLLFILLSILMFGCGSKKTTVATSSQETIEEIKDIDTRVSIDSASRVVIINKDILEIIRERITTEREYKPHSTGTDSIVSILVRETEITEREIEKRDTSVEASLEDGIKIGVDHTDRSKERIEREEIHEELTEREEAKNPRYVFWTVLLIFIVLAVTYLHRKFKIFNLWKR